MPYFQCAGAFRPCPSDNLSCHCSSATQTVMCFVDKYLMLYKFDVLLYGLTLCVYQKT